MNNYFLEYYFKFMLSKKHRFMLYKLSEYENCTIEEIFFRIIDINKEEILKTIEKAFKGID